MVKSMNNIKLILDPGLDKDYVKTVRFFFKMQSKKCKNLPPVDVTIKDKNYVRAADGDAVISVISERYKQSENDHTRIKIAAGDYKECVLTRGKQEALEREMNEVFRSWFGYRLWYLYPGLSKNKMVVKVIVGLYGHIFMEKQVSKYLNKMYECGMLKKEYSPNITDIFPYAKIQKVSECRIVFETGVDPHLERFIYKAVEKAMAKMPISRKFLYFVKDVPFVLDEKGEAERSVTFYPADPANVEHTPYAVLAVGDYKKPGITKECKKEILKEIYRETFLNIEYIHTKEME